MNPRLFRKEIKGRFLNQAAFVSLMTLVTSLCLWQVPYCRAGDTVTVNTSDDLQTLVNRYPTATTFSLAPGIHRLQTAVPKSYDSFVGQTGAILSGAALLTSFSQSGSYWTSKVQVTGSASYRGLCDSAHPACALPEDLFFDNLPKTRVASLPEVGVGKWYLDYGTGNAYMGDNPSGHTVEISLLPHAFSGNATSVVINNLVIEKFASVASDGAVHGIYSTGWTVEWCEARYNHGIGIRSGNGMYIYQCNAHDNGQLGIGGGGNHVTMQNCQIFHNNYAGYNFSWEAGLGARQK